MAYKRISPQPVNEGGTGQILNTDHGILLGQGTNPITSKTLTSGQILIGSTGVDPVSSTLTEGQGIDIINAAGSITIEVADDVPETFVTDAGDAIPVANELIVAGGTNINTAGAGSTVTVNLDSDLIDIQSLTFVSPTGLIGTGVTNGDHFDLVAYNTTSAAYESFAVITANAVPTMNLNTAVTIDNAYIYRAGGTDIPVSDGGTGNSAMAAYSVVCGGITDTDPLQSVASLGNAGQVLTSNGAAALPTWQDCGLEWSVVSVDATFTVNTGTIANKATLLTMTLPATAAIGDIIEITNMNIAVGWRIAQNANQYIRYGNSLTTTGAAGYIEATELGDSVRMVCMVAGASTGWIVVSSVGNLTIV